MGFIIEYYLICESQNNKTQVITLLLAPVRLGQQGNGIYYGVIMLLCVADQLVSGAVPVLRGSDCDRNQCHE